MGVVRRGTRTGRSVSSTGLYCGLVEEGTMPRSRRWRLLLLVAVTWLVSAWYLLADDVSYSVRPSFQQDHGISDSLSPHGKSSTPKRIRWSKLPENYPVTSLRALPTPDSRPGASAGIPHIQKRPRPVENAAAQKEREARREAVRDSFQHSWRGYRKYAWLRDEVTPLTAEAQDTFGGWAATLVDALDTLWIMGLRDEFEQAVRACKEIDFTLVQESAINVFETTIRYLGGFLAAYELSEKRYPLLLEKAVEVGELLMCAFDTPNHMPIPRWKSTYYMSGKPQWAPMAMIVSELGSFSLEFTKLSQLTGNMKYYDAAQRIMDEFERGQFTTRLPGMWPIAVGPGPSFNVDNVFTLGAMSDSFYEYLPKQYLLLDGLMDQPRKMYEAFIEVARQHLFRRVLNPDNIPLLVSGDARVTGSQDKMKVSTTPRAQHLTCFVGGMVGLAARAFNRPDDLDMAVQLTDGCVWAYNNTVSGIGPEIYTFVACGSVDDSQTGEKCAFSNAKWRTGVRNYWSPPSSVVEETEADRLEAEQFAQENMARRRLPRGMVDIYDAKYALRPEAIESVFILYRITGDPSWMDKAWEMFRNIERHTRTSIAAASLANVMAEEPEKLDNMESFWLGETLKYFYLIFSDWDTVSLDEWVLNTEAHPFRRPGI
ncbi:hypothetical protein VTK73DRAFT_7412 [Phialemonium thermophilum]|uniref:alpha-1,2-Mannosidase n=1 Tax=Phialemonium thermophilum TaxID=223376 RepID=A0ABR3XTJ7_9PEZI